MTLVYLLEPLEHLLRHILNGCHSIGLPWAWSIVALTVIVRMLLVPLTVKQIHSMQNMQAHAPEMKEIQRKYKGDRQKLNEELMKFYKEKNINPASSCLPLLAQFPIFIGLYYTLRNFAKDPPPGDLSWLHFVPSIAEHVDEHWSGYVLLAVYVGEPARVDVLHVRDDAAVAAGPDVHPPVRVHLRHRALPGRARPLLDDDEPLDGRPGTDHAAADPEGRAAWRRREQRAASARRERRRRTRLRAGPPAQPRMARPTSRRRSRRASRGR